MVAADMTKKGYDVTPSSEGLSHDLIAEKDGKLLRVQVKSVRIRERDGVRYRVIDCTNGNRDTYQNVDLYAGYEPNSGQIYYISHADLDGKKELWLHPSKLYALE
jgi:hypothetical protein